MPSPKERDKGKRKKKSKAQTSCENLQEKRNRKTVLRLQSKDSIETIQEEET